MFITTLALTASLAAPTLTAGDIDWYQDGYNKAIRQAKSQDQLIFVAFVPATSEYSRKLLAETFPDERVAEQLADLICLQFTDETDRGFVQLQKLFNVESYPTFIIANASGRIEDRIEGFIPPEPMVEQMTRIKSGIGTVGWHRAQTEAEPGNLELVYSLATMLDNVRDERGAEQAYAEIRVRDPHGHTAVGARLLLDELWSQVGEAGGDDRAAWDVEPVYAFVGQLETPSARFEAYGALGNFEAGVGRMGKSFDAFMAAWEAMPDDTESRGWARDVARFIVENGEEQATPAQREFALTLASHAAALAQQERDAFVAEHGNAKSEDGGDYDAWVASHIDVLVWAQFAFGEAETKQLAVSNCKRCIELDPENPEYQGRLAMLESSL